MLIILEPTENAEVARFARPRIGLSSTGATRDGWDDANANAYSDRVQIEFSSAKTIYPVVVYQLQDDYGSRVESGAAMTFPAYGVTAFTVQGWISSASVTLATVSGNKLLKRAASFAAFTIDRIRINITGALASFTEVDWGIEQPVRLNIPPFQDDWLPG